MLGKVDTIKTFTHVSEFPVSAGIGLFNASFSSYWEPRVLAFHVASLVPILFHDTRSSHFTSSVTDGGSGSGGISYFYTGGMRAISPSPDTMTQFPEADTFIVQGEQGLQVDYWNVSAGDVLTSADCRTWATEYLGFIICISTSKLNQNNLIAGFFPTKRR